MSMRKIITGIVFGVAALALAGCGNKNVSTSVTPSQSKTSSTQDAMSSDSVVQKMPPATGKVDDTVNAIIDGANSEGTQAISTDADAAAAVGDGTDTNNLNSTYDQNAL